MRRPEGADILAVDHAYLHQAVSVPGTKLVTTRTLTPSKIEGIKLGWSLVYGGLIVRISGKTVLIPSPNVASVILSVTDNGEA
jgi:hypothetical protein